MSLIFAPRVQDFPLAGGSQTGVPETISPL